MAKEIAFLVIWFVTQIISYKMGYTDGKMSVYSKFVDGCNNLRIDVKQRTESEENENIE